MATIASPSKSYLALIQEFPLRPLRSEEELDAAITMINKLIDQKVSEEGLDEQEFDYLDVLSDLIHAYEAKTNPLPDLEPVAALRHLLAENGISQSQLAQETGLAVTTISEILNGRRSISPKTRKALAERFRVSPSLFA
ncbi:helix-turn-helix domain-containing protein [Singulisphaera acidiphila]|uniref:Putative transcription regulator containing HTH domain n=1 Tax=Singulisphaera acidiphila (strain ATCC BAA-1392 / DSM 18658 / VKM B-2454 / MOB10) TaxID=886293 RepID=L0DCL8_SINAD|nr:helix-turn-helix domain-containing protein [Singulisphaera acidiphila]AGA27124.1 putative transcription regulator containing HTH domain [Singulisphaera acidiphila DSM 18658]